MSSAVLDRVLAIPDHDDVPQMGLSRSGLAALVERGGVTLDGKKAKSSVLKRADVKGDRPMVAVSMKDDLQNAWDRASSEYTANPTPDNYRNLDGKAKAYEMGYMLFGESERWTNAKKNAALIAEKNSVSTNTPAPIAAKSAKIAPDTAKKIKSAIAGVKGGKRFGNLPQKTDQDYLKPQSQYLKEYVTPKNRYFSGYDAETAKEDHKNFVKDALKSGRRVPQEVLKDYPDLKRTGVKKRKAGLIPRVETLKRRSSLYNKLVD
jgi:hypothetical protein